MPSNLEKPKYTLTNGQSLNGDAFKPAEKRNSNIELLRIISMFLIILYHLVSRGGLDDPAQPLYVLIPSIALGSWGILGVDIFIAVSAWFLCEQKFSIKRIVRVLLSDIIYLIFFCIVSAIMQYSETHSVFDVLKSIFMFWFNDLKPGFHWFVIVYIMMCFLSPFLNMAFSGIGQKYHGKILLILTLIMIWSQFSGSVGGLGIFLYIYVLTAYIKFYKPDFSRSEIGKLVLICTISIAVFIGLSFTQNISLEYPLRLLFANKDRCSLSLALIAVMLLVITVNIKPRYNKTICIIGKTTFGIYLFHETKYNGGTLIDSLREYAEKKWADKIGLRSFTSPVGNRSNSFCCRCNYRVNHQ